VKSRPFLTREALYWLTLFAPAITLLVSNMTGQFVKFDRVMGCILSTWTLTVVCGLTTHFSVNLTASVLANRSRAVMFGGIALVMTIVITLCMELMMPRLVWVDPNLAGSPSRFVYQALALGAIYTTVARIATWLKYRAKESEERRLHARLAALQSQVNPHFLFNTLNAIASLIPKNPDLAEGTVERLAGVLQYSIASSARGRVMLSEEVAAVRDYLEIEHARFGDRLRSKIDIDEAIADAPIPPMLVQPLVENAVLHGLSSREEGGTIFVRGRADGNAIVLAVSDDGVGPGRSKRKGNKTGLDNLRERLAITYGSEAKLSVGAREGGGFECEIRLPRAAS
jgi:two-component sensor histidine kinase